MALIRLILDWFVLGMFLWIILSYVTTFGGLSYDHPVRKIYDALSSVFEPMLRPIRNVVPPLRVGGSALDLSPIILILGVSFLAGFF